jgi:hypothetical protein
MKNRMFRGFTIGIFFLSVALFADAQTSKASKSAITLDSEAGKVLAAAQHQIADLSGTKKQEVFSAFDEIASKQSPFTSLTIDNGAPHNALTTNPKALTLRQKNDLLSWIQQTQQVVDPSLTPSTSSSQDPQDLVSAFSSSKPLTPAEIQKYTANVARIPVLAKSVGRLLISVTAGSTWVSKGTVFVTKKNVVATACHVIEPIVDVSNGTLSLRKNIIAVVDFSDDTLPDDGTLPSGLQTYPVNKILSVGTAQGCDVALLQISGADSIEPLKVDESKSLPARIIVIGYPKLDDLSDLVCTYAIEKTQKFFCQFWKANKGAAKVKSPGSTYTPNSHNGIDVFTYNAATREGQSGSPVLDLETLRVVGIHYCCTGADIPDLKLACATWHAQNLEWNEAISTKSILKDKALRDYVQLDQENALLEEPKSGQVSLSMPVPTEPDRPE